MSAEAPATPTTPEEVQDDVTQAAKSIVDGRQAPISTTIDNKVSPQENVVESILDVEVDRIPDQTITLEEYKRRGGLAIADQAKPSMRDPAWVTGAIGGDGQEFAFNQKSMQSKSKHRTDTPD